MQTKSTHAQPGDLAGISNQVRRLILMLVIGILGACAAASLSARAGHDAPVTRTHQDAERDADTPLPSATSRSVVAGQISQPTDTLPGLAVMLTRHGFEPSKIVRPIGKFALAVVPRVGFFSLSLSLNGANGAQLRSKQLPRESPQWVEVFDLAPGRYTLRETNHIDWVCEIVIE